MQFAKLKKASIFVDMIVKSALFFLGIVDFFCDSYENATNLIGKSKNRKVLSTNIVEQAKPAYSVL